MVYGMILLQKKNGLRYDFTTEKKLSSSEMRYRFKLNAHERILFKILKVKYFYLNLFYFKDFTCKDIFFFCCIVSYYLYPFPTTYRCDMCVCCLKYLRLYDGMWC